MSAMPAEPDPDYAKCQQVLEVVQKVMDTDPPKPDWMTGEFANMLHSQMHAAYTFIFMELLKRGVSQDEAKESAQMQAPLVAFELGMRVGKELEAADSIRRMFEG